METNNKQTMQNEKTLKLNPLFYPPEVIYSASYVLLDKAYFTFDGDPKSEVHVHIIPKEGFDAEKISKEFYDELVTYLEYRNNYERNKDIRHIILQKALETAQVAPSVSPGEGEAGSEKENDLEEIDEEDLFDSADDDLSYLEEDPLEIAVPWEEKYGGDEKPEEDSKENNVEESPEKQQTGDEE